MKTDDVTGVVLAGGQSRRMGADKASMMVGGKPMIAHAIDRLREVLPEVVVVAKDVCRLDLAGVRVIADAVSDKTGALVGIYSALKAAKTPYVFVVACDMPHIRPELVRWMVETCQGCDAFVPRIGSAIEPLFALYSRNCLPFIEKRLGDNDLRVRGFFDDVNTVYAEERDLRTYDPGLTSLVNINTMEDLQNVRRLMGDPARQAASPKVDPVEADESAYRVVRVLKLRGAGEDGESVSESDDMVISETAVEVLLNGEAVRTIQCSPHEVESLAIGHLLSERFIDPFHPFSVTVQQGAPMKIHVRVPERRVDRGLREAAAASSNTLQVTSGTICNSVDELLRKSPLFGLTGAAHAAGLCSTCGIVYWNEDVSRHNAVDRVLGQCFLEGNSFEDKFLVTTGRMNWEMVQKAASCGVGLVASKAPPTDKGVTLAEELGVTLVGFVRNRRFNVYSHPERMVRT